MGSIDSIPGLKKYMNNIKDDDIDITKPLPSIRRARKSGIPSGYFGESPENIVEIEEVVTVEEQNFLLNFAKNNKMWDITESQYNENGNIIYDHRVWENRVATYHTLLASNPDVIPVLEDIVGRIKIKIEEKFKVRVLPTSPTIVRWPEGTLQHPHADKELHEGPDAGTENEFPWYDIGTIFYLNDDYEGGELHFPKQEISFKPKARAAYFFPGDMNYIHGVNMVKSGCRYTSPWFWTVTEIIKDE